MSDDTLSGQGSVGSVGDIVGRMRAVLPASWFPVSTLATDTTSTPILDGLLSGIAQAWSLCYGMLVFARLQTRLSTLTGSFLDLYANDFFGSDIRRAVSEADQAFRQRIQAALLPAKATRIALIEMLSSMTGIRQSVIEPARAADTGGYGIEAVVYGSRTLPFQFLLNTSNGLQTTKRESVATYIDSVGLLQLVDRHVIRAQYAEGVATGIIIEPRGFNLIKDSVGWSGFTIVPTGSSVTWSVGYNRSLALWQAGLAMSLSISGDGLVIGPSVTVPAGGVTTASAWLRIPSGHQLGTLRLIVSDGTVAWYATVDLTLADCWQRVSATVPQASGSISIGLVGTSNGITLSPIYTQCWQAEPGSSVTSYIPSSFQIGFRDADILVSSDQTGTNRPDLNVATLRNAINRVIPAGSVAWLRA